jgi:hypothetical protein
VACVPLTDRAIEEAYDLELVVRFVVLVHAELEQLHTIGELGTFLTDQSLELAAKPQKVLDETAAAFASTFAFLASNLAGDSFKRYDAGRSKYSGAMLISIFEVVATGLGKRFLKREDAPDVEEFLRVHKGIWASQDLTGKMGSGVRASTRIPNTVSFGTKWFAS